MSGEDLGVFCVESDSSPVWLEHKSKLRPGLVFDLRIGLLLSCALLSGGIVAPNALMDGCMLKGSILVPAHLFPIRATRSTVTFGPRPLYPAGCYTQRLTTTSRMADNNTRRISPASLLAHAMWCARCSLAKATSNGRGRHESYQVQFFLGEFETRQTLVSDI